MNLMLGFFGDRRFPSAVILSGLYNVYSQELVLIRVGRILDNLSICVLQLLGQCDVKALL